MAAYRKATLGIAEAAATLLLLIFLPCGVAARVFSFRANVPFQFVVGRETLPAATYTVEVLLNPSKVLDPTGVIVLKTPGGRIYRAAFTTVADSRRMSSPRPSLVFRHQERKHYLVLVTMASTDLSLGIAGQGLSAKVIHSVEIPMEILR